jgi:hypothetical protein
MWRKKKTQDVRGRRIRWNLTPTGKECRLNEAAIDALHFIASNGFVTSEYIKKWAKIGQKYRLLDLCAEEYFSIPGHDTVYRKPLLYRPPQQYSGRASDNGHLIYGLTETGEQVLKDLGKWSEYFPVTSGAFWHDVMVTSLVASVQIQCRERGLTFYPQHVILERAGKKLQYKSSKGNLNPDGLFAIGNGSKVIAFLVEGDKGTEQLTKTIGRKSIAANWEQYEEFFVEDHFNLQCQTVVLNLTVADSRLRTMIELIGEHFPKGGQKLLNHAIPEFAPPCDPPPLLDILSIAWQRFNLPPVRILDL